MFSDLVAFVNNACRAKLAGFEEYMNDLTVPDVLGCPQGQGEETRVVCL